MSPVLPFAKKEKNRLTPPVLPFAKKERHTLLKLASQGDGVETKPSNINKQTLHFMYFHILTE